MNPIIADWQSQPTEEQVAALYQVLTNYSTASKEAKAMVGKAIIFSPTLFSYVKCGRFFMLVYIDSDGGVRHGKQERERFKVR